MDFLNIYKTEYKNLNELEQIYNSIPECISLIQSVFNLPQEKLQNASILIKPNWVMHPKKYSDNNCLITHGNFILSALEVILEYKPKKIIIGDAPIQGCEWNKLIDKNFLQKTIELSAKTSIPIQILDFRRTILNKKYNQLMKDIISLDNYTIFDLGVSSYLEPISKRIGTFRVGGYDPGRLSFSHNPGVHKYCITKELFNADVIISMPKIKTHQKVGITGALKNLVGFNGDKDFLPHHRVGGTGFGGDCYPGKNYLRRISEYFLDHANRNIGKFNYYPWKYLAMSTWWASLPTRKHHLGAGWYGNDTTWRMVMDLNIIAKYGKADGFISDIPQREIFSLCDGIIGGQADGPLKPVPLPLGVISFTNNSALNDAAMAILMGFDIERMPLIINALKYLDNGTHLINFNGSIKNLEDLNDFKIDTIPPPGWGGYIA